MHLPASCGLVKLVRWRDSNPQPQRSTKHQGRGTERRTPASTKADEAGDDEATGTQGRKSFHGSDDTRRGRPIQPDRTPRSLFLSRGGRDFFPGHSPPDWTVASRDSLTVPHWTGPQKAGRLPPFWVESRSETMSLMIGRRARPCPRGRSRLWSEGSHPRPQPETHALWRW